MTKPQPNTIQCVKLTCSLAGPAGLVKKFYTRPAVLTLDRVSALNNVRIDILV